MRILNFICALSLLGSPFISASEASLKNSESRSQAENLDAWIENALHEFHIPGAAVGVVVDNEVVLLKGYGKRDLEAGLPATEETLFAIGSCTKAFTTFVLGQMVEEGKIAWDDPVIKHLPEFCLQDAHVTKQITIRDLVTHRSGLPRHDLVWYNTSIPREEFLKRLPHLPLSCGLREKFQYNNLMYVVAGLLIEKITGKTWEEEIKSRIFIPLGMDNSNFSTDQSQLGPDFALPYTEKEGGAKRISFQNISRIGPAGSINSSASQMIKWMQLQLSDGEDLIKRQTLHEMHLIQTPIPNSYAPTADGSLYMFGYGLGWVTGWYKGNYTVMHTGGIDGFRSAIALFPNQKVGVIVLTNSDAHKQLATRLAYTIADYAMGKPQSQWMVKLENNAQKKEEVFEETPPGQPLEAYAGKFEHPGYGTLSIFVDDGVLTATLNAVVYILKHKSDDRFELGLKSKPSSSFESSFNEDLSQFHIVFEPSTPTIVFERKS